MVPSGLAMPASQSSPRLRAAGDESPAPSAPAASARRRRGRARSGRSATRRPGTASRATTPRRVEAASRRRLADWRCAGRLRQPATSSAASSSPIGIRRSRLSSISPPLGRGAVVLMSGKNLRVAGGGVSTPPRELLRRTAEPARRQFWIDKFQGIAASDRRPPGHFRLAGKHRQTRPWFARRSGLHRSTPGAIVGPDATRNKEPRSMLTQMLPKLARESA